MRKQYRFGGGILSSLHHYLTHPQAIIPGLISNRLVCAVIDRVLKRSTKSRVIEENAVHNRQLLENVPFYTKGEFIENQGVKSTKTSPGWDAVRFSNGSMKWRGQTYRSSMNYSGCEIMACYNALLVLEAGKSEPEIDLVPIISYFERDGAALRGLAGASSRAIERFFARRGYATAMTYSSDPTTVGRWLQDYEVAIITVYNSGQDIRRMIHTMCVTMDKGDNGVIERMQLHNCSHRDVAGRFTSMEYRDMEAIMAGYKDGAAKLLCAIGIK